MLGTVPLWLHIVAATAWVGSQIMMFVVVVPSLRLAGDATARYQLLRGVTVRFGYLGLVSLLVLIATGIDNIDRYAPANVFDVRYGYILAVKLTMVALVVLLTALHTFVVGPRLLALQAAELEAAGFSPEALRSLKLRSITVSSLTLLLSLAILFCAALLRSRFAFGSV